jgi:hypothetical protein
MDLDTFVVLAMRQSERSRSRGRTWLLRGAQRPDDARDGDDVDRCWRNAR